MPLKITREVLIADQTVVAAVGDRISPVNDQTNEQLPRIVISGAGVEPVNSLSGWAGLDRCMVDCAVFAVDYSTAKSIADACRAAMEAAGHLTKEQFNDRFQFDSGVIAFCVGYQFQIWQSSE